MAYQYSDWTSVVSETTGDAYTRTPTDVSTLGDNIAKALDYGRTYQRFALHDLLVVGDQFIRFVLNDMGLFDSVVRAFTADRTMSDVETLADEIARERGRQFGDTTELSDTILCAASFVRAVSDVLELSDEEAVSFLLQLILGDNAGLSDVVFLTSDLVRLYRIIGRSTRSGSFFKRGPSPRSW